MDGVRRRRSAYRQVLRALDEAIFRLSGASAAETEAFEEERQGIFRLGEAAGIAFSAHLPATGTEALFDALSDAAETDDLDRMRQLRSLVESRVRAGSDAADGTPGSASAPAANACDWDAGYLQILAVLNETRRAREDGDVYRYWLMSGFLAGLLHWDTRPGGEESGSLQDAVVAACNDGWGETLWLEWEAIRDAWLAGDGTGSRVDEDLLLSWQGLRLAAADRMADTPFSSLAGVAAGDPGAHASEEWAVFLRCERSTRRAQNFGRRNVNHAGGEPSRG